MGKTTWTDEEIEQIVILNQKGHTASEIGEKIGRSRNAVISKLNRIDEPIFIRVKKKLQKNRSNHFDICIDGCRYMGGGNDNFVSCGREIFKKEMCEKHYRLCYIPIKSKKETDKAIDDHKAKTQGWKGRAV